MRVVLIGALVFVAVGCGNCSRTPCDEQASHLVARAYYLSNPFFGHEDEVLGYVREHKAEFAPGGNATRCMHGFAKAVLQKATNGYGNSPATDRWGSAVGPEITRQVDTAIRNYSYDELNMGREFEWLSVVLPRAALGDDEPFNRKDSPRSAEG